MKAVVVLPLVPVTAITARSALGSQKKRAAAGPIAARTEPTTTSGTPRPSGRSTTSAAAPRATASAAKSCPSLLEAGHGEEQRAGLHPAAVVGESRDLDARAGGEHLS